MWNTSVNIHCSLTRGLCGPRHKIVANYNSPAVLEHPRGSTHPRVHGGPHHYPMRSPFHFANLSLIQLTSPNSYRACACLRSLESHPISWKLQSNSLEMITRVSKQCHLRIYHHRRNYKSNQNWFTVFTLPYLAALANTAETRQNICDAVCDKIIDRATEVPSIILISLFGAILFTIKRTSHVLESSNLFFFFFFFLVLVFFLSYNPISYPISVPLIWSWVPRLLRSYLKMVSRRFPMIRIQISMATSKIAAGLRKSLMMISNGPLLWTGFFSEQPCFHSLLKYLYAIFMYIYIWLTFILNPVDSARGLILEDDTFREQSAKMMFQDSYIIR